MTTSTRVDLTLMGIRTRPPLSRGAGAGPSHDGHFRIDGTNAAVWVNPESPYWLTDDKIIFDGVETDLDVRTVERPRFYDLRTADGISYEQLARLHGADVLATTVVQTCVRYGEDQRCRFCAIEESLRNSETVAVKRPADLAEVAEAAVRLDGVSQLVMTTGTSAGRDRGATHLARCVRAVRTRLPELPIQVQCEPPADLASLAELRAAGADSIGIHVESLDDEVRARWMPGKSTVPLAAYWAAWDEAVRIFGRNQVSTYLLIGLGEDPDELVAGAERLIELGVYPFVVPFRPVAGTLAVRDGATAPNPALVGDISARVATTLRAAGMLSSGQKAGCAACGACGVLKAQGG